MVSSNIVAQGLIILIGQLFILVNVKCVVHVTTQLGTVKGISMLSRRGQKFNAFLGIPFAKPPIGDLRFKVNFQPFFHLLVLFFIITK